MTTSQDTSLGKWLALDPYKRVVAKKSALDTATEEMTSRKVQTAMNENLAPSSQPESDRDFSPKIGEIAKEVDFTLDKAQQPYGKSANRYIGEKKQGGSSSIGGWTVLGLLFLLLLVTRGASVGVASQSA